MENERMTIDDLLRMTTPTIPGTLAAKVMGMSSTRLLGYARERPELLPFNYILSGNHMKISRLSFLKWVLDCTDEELEKKMLR